MSDKEFNDLNNKLQLGLDKAFIEMLKLKSALNQSVVVTDDNGEVVIVPARELLKKYNL